MATLIVGTNTWVTEAEANTFYSERIGADDYWVSGAEKIPALITAYKWLKNSDAFSLPMVATQNMKDAQCEMALFLLQHQPDIDTRIGLRAQGVVEAGIVKEKYDGVLVLPFPPQVSQLLATYKTYLPLRLVNIDRDENERVGYNVTDDLL